MKVSAVRTLMPCLNECFDVIYKRFTSNTLVYETNCSRHR